MNDKKTHKLIITSPMPPSVNHYVRHSTIMRNGKAYPVVYETKEAKDYKREFERTVKIEAERQGWEMLPDGKHCIVDAWYYFDRIDKDASNYEKCMIDAITETGLVWKDDNIVLYRPQRILYDRNDPRIELVIYPAGYTGIFKDDDEKKVFEESCKKCRRYGRCQEYKKACEGRITGGVDLVTMKCLKKRAGNG